MRDHPHQLRPAGPPGAGGPADTFHPPPEHAERVGGSIVGGRAPERRNVEMPRVWVYDGRAYDLSDFIARHPGGEFYIGRMQNRDITTVMNSMHADPARQRRMLERYALHRDAVPEDLHPMMNAPPFLFARGFDSRRDTPRFDFAGGSDLLGRIKRRLNAPEERRRTRRMDRLFDAVTLVLACLYVLVQAAFLSDGFALSAWLFVPSIVALRVALSGAGHYFNHRAFTGWNKVLAHVFDINYVSKAFVALDGHTLMHHPHTQSGVDVKRNVFDGMMILPRGFRVPLHTLHKIGHVLCGNLIRVAGLCAVALRHPSGVRGIYGDARRAWPHYAGMVLIKSILFAELALFWYHGELWIWFVQFALTVWISTFLVVASHDFESDEGDAPPSGGGDWAAFQIRHAHDLTITGNRYVDCLLSAGLSPHRVHHVLPYQRSGFANVASEAIVREEAERAGVVWERPRHFLLERIPELARQYLAGPSVRAARERRGLAGEHLSRAALADSARYVCGGFCGVGNI